MALDSHSMVFQGKISQVGVEEETGVYAIADGVIRSDGVGVVQGSV